MSLPPGSVSTLPGADFAFSPELSPLRGAHAQVDGRAKWVFHIEKRYETRLVKGGLFGQVPLVMKTPICNPRKVPLITQMHYEGQAVSAEGTPSFMPEQA